MPQRHFDPDEARRRIGVLSKLPETPTRRLELAALRRALETDAQTPQRTRRLAASTPRRRRVAPEVPETPPKPSREMERTVDGRKRLIVRKRKPAPVEPEKDPRDERERRRLQGDMREMLGDGFRGMS